MASFFGSRSVFGRTLWHRATQSVAVLGTLGYLSQENQQTSPQLEGTDTLLRDISREAERRLLRSRQTVRRFEDRSTKKKLDSVYSVDRRHPLGRGTFGVVYLGESYQTGERVAVKEIAKEFTDYPEVQVEMRALMKLKQNGGHPNICGLVENFTEGSYFLVLDLIEGVELFEHLINLGSYSEADAARLIREIGAALAFVHGLGIVHGDLKPENLMLNSKNPSNAVMKLIDFGCAAFVEDEDVEALGRTVAYSPPEVLAGTRHLNTAIDMWALGVILYIMLTGVHPYDLSGQATDEDVAQAILSGKRPPLRNSPLTAHLSDSAINLMERLMDQDASQRLSAQELLEHPWTKGITANQDKMANSDKRLFFRAFRSGLAKTFFGNAVEWSDEHDNEHRARKTGIIARTFEELDRGGAGHLTKSDLEGLSSTETEDNPDDSKLTLSDVSDLIAEQIQNRFFPKDTVVYREGEQGNSMYFINSGRVRVQTKAGSSVERTHGDFFGEGALFHPEKLRSATITCDTPVHAMEIKREQFERYLSQDPSLLLTLREKDKIRKRNRAKMILRKQESLQERFFGDQQVVFKNGEPGDSLYLVQSGKVDIFENGHYVLTATPGNVFGEYSVVMGRPRNSTAICKGGCLVQELMSKKFWQLTKESPAVLTSLRDLCLRRDFKKAVVHRLKKEFPYKNPREAFDVVRGETTGDRPLDVESVGKLMRELNPHYTDEEILEVIRTMDLTDSGTVSFDEFKKVFVADILKSASI